MYVMRPLRNFKTNQCCHLISRIANRALRRYLPGKQYRILRKGKAVVRAYPHHFYPTIKDPLPPQVRK